MKALGADRKEFYNTGWPEGYFHDDYDENLVGKDGEMPESLNDLETYELDRLGWLFPNGMPNSGKKEISFARAFGKWKKDREFTMVSVDVPNSRKDELMALLKAHGFKGHSPR